MKIAKGKKQAIESSKQKTVAISLVLILAALLIALNLDKFTGQTVRSFSTTKMYLSADPDIADQGEVAVDKGNKIYITVDPGNEGSSATIYIYDVNAVKEKRVRSVELETCSTICKHGIIATATITASSNWKGKYCARIKDIGSGQEEQSCFTVR